MYNDNTELLKLVGLNQYDIDKEKTTVYVDMYSNDIIINLYLKDAYYLKEEYREFNLCGTYDEALEKLDEFIEKFKKAHYVEFREFASLLERWKFYIINSFIVIDGKRMSNGPMESLNVRINNIKFPSF